MVRYYEEGWWKQKGLKYLSKQAQWSVEKSGVLKNWGRGKTAKKEA